MAQLVNRTKISTTYYLAKKPLLFELEINDVFHAGGGGHEWLKAAECLRGLLEGSRWVEHWS